VDIPLITSNRINTPELAEEILEQGKADMVSMARPFLADAEFVKKAESGESSSINTCIACNQGCLDRVFKKQRATCLVNPRACYETELEYVKTQVPKKIVVIGLGPAGMACASIAAQRGHNVVVYEAEKLGGQLNLAVHIPGKKEFYETLRYFKNSFEKNNVIVNTGSRITAEELQQMNCDVVVIATGVKPRIPEIEGIRHSKVIIYKDVFGARPKIGNKVAIIGAGGIGFDVASLLLHDEYSSERWMHEWGIDAAYAGRGGLLINPEASVQQRKITLLQRKQGKMGKSLGKTTGWIHRLSLRKAGVEMLTGVDYRRIDDAGLHIVKDGEESVLDVDTVVICAGQLPENSLQQAMLDSDKQVYVIGGADEARELDAERAIRQGVELAAKI